MSDFIRGTMWASLGSELRAASKFLALRPAGAWMGWADFFGLSMEATILYHREYGSRRIREGVIFPLKPIHRWDRLAALNRAARKADGHA